MSTHTEHITDFQSIIELANKKADPAELFKRFKDYLESIKSLEWKKDNSWIEEAYKFGEIFKNNDPSVCLEVLDEKISDSKVTEEIELLEFIKSEVYVNFFPPEDGLTYFKELTAKYPVNPEFRNSLFVIHNQLDNKLLAIENKKQAIKLNAKEKWKNKLYNYEYGYANDLIKEKKHEEADIYLNKLIKSDFYTTHYSSEYQNFFIFLRQRNEDQLLIESKLDTMKLEANQTINSLFEKSRLRIIEILGFFMAIVAFIFGSITIAIKSDLTSALILITSFGLMMLIFVISLSIVFVRNSSKFYQDKRLIALLIIILINVSLVIFNDSIKTILDTLTQ